MRFISHDYIPPDAVLARSIIGANGEILLAEGSKMKPAYIQRLKELGIQGIYVSDSLSEGLEIADAISDELRSYAIKNIFSVFTKTVEDNKVSSSSSILMKKTAEMIVEEIISKGDVLINMSDMKAYDNYTFFHCLNVTVLSVVMGFNMDMPHRDLVKLAYAALLHDIGKMFIDINIINKPGKLTDEEFEIVKKHPRDGYNHIKGKFFIHIPEISARAVLEHHERVDGSGYPDRKKNKEITKFARILAVADVYDALISNRPYRKGMFPVEAMEFVQGGAGTMFDFDIVSSFSRKIALFPVGTCVMLSNSAVGLVMENYEGFSQRPLLKIFKHGDDQVNPYLLNLRQGAFDVTIISSINA